MRYSFFLPPSLGGLFIVYELTDVMISILLSLLSSMENELMSDDHFLIRRLPFHTLHYRYTFLFQIFFLSPHKSGGVLLRLCLKHDAEVVFVSSFFLSQRLISYRL